MCDYAAETERVKRFLKRYRKNRALVIRLNSRVAEYEEQIIRLKASTYSDMPKGGAPVTSEDLILEKMETEKRVENLKAKGLIIRAEILEKIDELEDVRQAEILEAFCIDCLSFIDIADKIGYSERRVIAIYSEAIKNITL